MIDLPHAGENEWISTLKPYQSSVIESLLKKGTEEQALDLWLTSSGPIKTSPFGGGSFEQNTKKEFLINFKLEFKALVCGDAKYEKDRESLNKIGNNAKTYIVSTISAIIAASLGTTAAFIAPAVVLMLMIISKMGVNAWCAL
ncbi:hypothetical protein [Providencia rettgeri]|uniref:hypothetical protein n=1 Tax=Providencia rettgeri TaxID=587 RepID=UPI001E334B71|nr:hypothetical protein LMY39_14090 [Providencia rettgeri]